MAFIEKLKKLFSKPFYGYCTRCGHKIYLKFGYDGYDENTGKKINPYCETVCYGCEPRKGDNIFGPYIHVRYGVSEYGEIPDELKEIEVN